MKLALLTLKYRPKVTLAGTADWLIQNETHDMATSKMEGM